VPPKFNFFFATSQFDWPITQKEIKIFELPQHRRLYFEPPLWPTYIGERRITFAKAYGIKVRCYGEHVGDILGT